LKRKVEVYQWNETTHSETFKEPGGRTATKTSYNYTKVWSESSFDSNIFNQIQGHVNPVRTRPYYSLELVASNVSIGTFFLSPELIQKMDNYELVTLNTGILSLLPPELAGRIQVLHNALYIGRDSYHPEIGDMQVTFSRIPPSNITIVAQQRSNSFTGFVTSTGYKIEMLKIGSLSASQMFATAMDENRQKRWLFRVVGWFLNFVGLLLIIEPIGVLLDFIPLLGDIFRVGGIATTLIISLFFTCATVLWFHKAIYVVLLFVFVVFILRSTQPTRVAQS